MDDREGLTKERVGQIAELAKLSLTEKERERVGEEMKAILAMMKLVGQVDTKGVEPMTGFFAPKTAWREDEPAPGGGTEAALMNAPEREGDFFRIPPLPLHPSGNRRGTP